MNPTLLDTDILSEALKGQNSTVAANVLAYLAVHPRLSFSAMTRFEALRGFLERGATTQLTNFETVCLRSDIIPISDAILDRSAHLWAFARRGGHPCRDADLIIGATALESGFELATGNTLHFQWMPGLVLRDWRQP